jgi:hypothetical protein
MPIATFKWLDGDAGTENLREANLILDSLLQYQIDAESTDCNAKAVQEIKFGQFLN